MRFIRRAPDDAVMPTDHCAGHPRPDSEPRAEHAACGASPLPHRIDAPPPIEPDRSQRSGRLHVTMRWVVEQLTLSLASYALAIHPELRHPDDGPTMARPSRHDGPSSRRSERSWKR
jgi:hypothetical protein